jgi:predicted secreted protein
MFTQKDAGKTLKVSVGDTVVVRLPATPGTGYVWHVARPDGVAMTEKTRFELLEKGQPGARAAQVFQFEVRKAGQHELRFSYGRGEEVVRTCTFRLDAW